MLKVGLTGGIGSGKSTVCDIFRCLEVPVYEADKRARLLMNEEASLRELLVAAFGKQIYTGAGIDRAGLASRVFSDPGELQRLNSLVHPYVLRDFGIWLRKQGNASYIIHEAAILFETGASRLFDRVITVEAPLETRIQRVVQRDGSTREAVGSRIRNQMSSEERVKLADYVIRNGENDMLVPQVLDLHGLLGWSIHEGPTKNRQSGSE